MWALGVTAYATLCGRPPFYSPSVMDLFELIEAGVYPPLPPAVASGSARELIARMLEPRPADRISLADVLVRCARVASERCIHACARVGGRACASLPACACLRATSTLLP